MLLVKAIRWGRKKHFPHLLFSVFIVHRALPNLVNVEERQNHWTQIHPLLFSLQYSNFEQIPCQLDADGSGVHCQDVNCPFREEQLRIYLTVYIHSFSRLEVYTKVFYLREIGV